MTNYTSETRSYDKYFIHFYDKTYLEILLQILIQNRCNFIAERPLNTQNSPPIKCLQSANANIYMVREDTRGWISFEVQFWSVKNNSRPTCLSQLILQNFDRGKEPSQVFLKLKSIGGCFRGSFERDFGAKFLFYKNFAEEFGNSFAPYLQG